MAVSCNRYSGKAMEWGLREPSEDGNSCSARHLKGELHMRPRSELPSPTGGAYMDIEALGGCLACFLINCDQLNTFCEISPVWVPAAVHVCIPACSLPQSKFLWQEGSAVGTKGWFLNFCQHLNFLQIFSYHADSMEVGETYIPFCSQRSSGSIPWVMSQSSTKPF